MSTIAKGSKRPKSAFDGPLEVFSHGRIVFSDTTRERLATLTEFDQQPGFTHLPRNLFALNCCLFAAELLEGLTDEYDPHPQLFDHFLRFLQSTNGIPDTFQASRDTLALLVLFQLALLKEVGLQPILSYCANCKTRYETRDTRYEVYFSSAANGLICKDCEAAFPDKLRLTHAAANCLSNVKLIAGSDEQTLNEIEEALIYHFTELLGRRPKMAKHILKG